ncbi:MAG TPA: hypothetical protein PLV92_26310, partial [Pirellulaceae bacterium]|nr:hypothetical protein [Pirellulaceae bacterium]
MTDDRPMTLDQACRELLGGICRPATLRRAIEAGTLQCERWGRRVVVTPRAIADWRKECQRKAKAPGSTTTSAPAEPDNGLSETDRDKSLLDALTKRAEMLKKRSPTTSPANTNRKSTVV